MITIGNFTLWLTWSAWMFMIGIIFAPPEATRFRTFLYGLAAWLMFVICTTPVMGFLLYPGISESVWQFLRKPLI